MKRRDFVKGLAVTTAAAGTALAQQKKAQATAPVPANGTLTQGEQAVAPNNAAAPAAQQRQRQLANFKNPNIPLSQPDLVARTDAHYFTPARYATLVHFADVVMPASSGYPGAVAAGAPEFLDFLIGASPADKQALWNAGLDQLNADCMKKSGVLFAQSSPQQADGAIRPYLKGWINDHPPMDRHENFIALAHRDVRMATMNSTAWAEAAEVSGERVNTGLYVHPLDPGIETWVNRAGAPKGSAPLTKQAHA